MSEYHYLCPINKLWVDSHPKEAFSRILENKKHAEQLLKKQHHKQAIAFLGRAFETAEMIFDNRIESTQLTITLTGLAIMLAHAYAKISKVDIATAILQRLRQKIQREIKCTVGYSTKVVYFEHCIQAITEARSDLSFQSQDIK
ncbi:hypothetical protein [Paraglaciecola marina]|uniref:hypothetical protein n=1 Tax=Paraglaciecola marina TaxID=2500157 RepID=UPI00105EA575|nr:hypothetical protein [Paraglaciecola marina]